MSATVTPGTRVRIRGTNVTGTVESTGVPDSGSRNGLVKVRSDAGWYTLVEREKLEVV